MRVALKATVPLILLSTFLGAASEARADAGVFTGNGQSLHQISSKTVQLVSIDVTIILGRGPFLFDGGVAGMDRAEYLCKFVLLSLSDKPEEVQIGFPVDSEFAGQGDSDSATASTDWVLDYAFIARDQKDTYHVEYVQRKAEKGPGEFEHLFSWNMHFEPKETKTLTVSYHIPMSMGLATTARDSDATPQSAGEPYQAFNQSGAFRPETLDLAMIEEAGYITSTGSSWAGNVETATFTLISEPFERYLGRRGVVEDSPGTGQEGTTKRESPFPLQHPWWFRQISPEGWKEVEGGVQWSYKDYKPKDAIEVRYFMTQLPQSPADVDTFADRFLKRLAPYDSAAAELTRAKDVLLATYGKEPEDGATKMFVEEQLWYSPRKDFSTTNLSETQKAILERLDARIALARTGAAK
jgi:hypothetical protein